MLVKTKDGTTVEAEREVGGESLRRVSISHKIFTLTNN